MDLFITPQTNILPCDGLVNYYGPILSLKDSNDYLQSLIKEIPWKNYEKVIYDKNIVTKRSLAWYSDESLKSDYGEGQVWTKELLSLKNLVEETTQTKFNSCLLNFYHNGLEGIGWHSDEEAYPQEYSAIASLSFGAERTFYFKHKLTERKVAIDLEHGGLLLMSHPTQHHWLHSLPKTKKINSPRINLTFRVVDFGN